MLDMERCLFLFTLLSVCTGRPSLLDLFRPRSSAAARADDGYQVPPTSDAYGVPQVQDDYTVPELSSYDLPPCPEYTTTTTTTTPAPSYHQRQKAKNPFHNVLGFLKSIPDSIVNIIKPQPTPSADYGAPCKIQDPGTYAVPEETGYSAPEESSYSAPQEVAYNAPQEVAYNAPEETGYTSPEEISYSAPETVGYQSPEDDYNISLNQRLLPAKV